MISKMQDKNWRNLGLERKCKTQGVDVVKLRYRKTEGKLEKRASGGRKEIVETYYLDISEERCRRMGGATR